MWSVYGSSMLSTKIHIDLERLLMGVKSLINIQRSVDIQWWRINFSQILSSGFKILLTNGKPFLVKKSHTTHSAMFYVFLMLFSGEQRVQVNKRKKACLWILVIWIAVTAAALAHLLSCKCNPQSFDISVNQF